MTIQKGLTAARYLKVKAAHTDDLSAAAHIDAARWLHGDTLKAAVAGFSSSNSPALQTIGGDFMAAVRERSIVGKLRERMRGVPLNTPVIRQTAGVNATWTAEGAPVAVERGTYVKDAPLELLKVCGISVVTKELAQAYGADRLISVDLEAACAAALDSAFTDPSNAGTPGKKPASVFSGASNVPSAGPGAAGFRADLNALLNGFGGNLDTSVVIADTATAVQLATMGLSNIEVDVTGESRLAGLPMVSSTAVPAGFIGLVDLNRVDAVGMDSAELSVSREADVLMSDAPTMSSTTPTATQMVSLFQVGAVGLLASVPANWRAAPGAARYITGASYLA